MSEGQKASFCLEDNDCNDGVSAVYDCENYGDQGITPGCKVRTYDFVIVDPRYTIKCNKIHVWHLQKIKIFIYQDIYHANIDCQWLDVTELPTGTYTFKLAINPEYKVICL